MGNQKSKYKSQIDLVERAQHLFDFLKSVERIPQLMNGEFTQLAIQRYERLWLPFAAQQTHPIMPPLDIEWVWQAHMTSPYEYNKDCETCVGKLIDYQCVAIDVRKKLWQKTEIMWKEKYPEEQFFVDFDDAPVTDHSFVSKLSCDLDNAIIKQRNFLYQVSLPHFRDQKFLKKALKRYRMLLLLMKEVPDIDVVSCYDMALIWRCHLLHPSVYEEETAQIFGKMLDYHHCGVSTAPTGSEMAKKIETTSSFLKAKGKTFVLPGTFYRGEPPLCETPEYEKEFTALVHKKYKLKLLGIKIENLPDDANYTIVASISKRNGANKLIHEGKLFRSKDGDESLTFRKQEGKLLIDSEDDRGLELKLIGRKNGLDDDGSDNERKFIIDVDHTTLSEDCDDSGYLPAIDFLVVNSEPDSLAVIEIMIDNSVRSTTPTNYHLKTEREVSNQSDNHLSEVLAYPDFMAPGCRVSPCQFSVNAFKDLSGDVAFGWKVIHSKEPEAVSVVEVYDNEKKLLATGHTIGTNALPNPKQISNPRQCVTLDPTCEKAMLVRNRTNDWAIVRGSWAGFKGGKKKINGGKTGRFVVEATTLGTHQPSMKLRSVVTRGLRKLNVSFFIHDQLYIVFMDMVTGTLRSEYDLPCLPEVLCLCCCVAVLYLLCQPLPPRHADTETRVVQPYVIPAGVLHPGNMPFLLCAGLYNYYLPRAYDGGSSRFSIKDYGVIGNTLEGAGYNHVMGASQDDEDDAEHGIQDVDDDDSENDTDDGNEKRQRRHDDSECNDGGDSDELMDGNETPIEGNERYTATEDAIFEDAIMDDTTSNGTSPSESMHTTNTNL